MVFLIVTGARLRDFFHSFVTFSEYRFLFGGHTLSMNVAQREGGRPEYVITGINSDVMLSCDDYHF